MKCQVRVLLNTRQGHDAWKNVGVGTEAPTLGVVNTTLHYCMQVSGAEPPQTDTGLRVLEVAWGYWNDPAPKVILRESSST